MQYSKEQQIGKTKKKKSRRMVRKILPVDRAFSFVVRAERGWECEWCHKIYAPYHKLIGGEGNGNNCQNLGISHFWSCGHWATRLDRENVDVLCNLPCHRYLGHGEGRQMYYDFKLKKLGKNGFDLLQILAHNTVRGKEVKLNQEMYLMDYMIKLKEDFNYKIDWFFKEYKMDDWIRRAIENGVWA